MDRTGWVRGGDRSAGQPMQRSGWIRAARYIAESFWRSVIVAAAPSPATCLLPRPALLLKSQQRTLRP